MSPVEYSLLDRLLRSRDSCGLGLLLNIDTIFFISPKAVIMMVFSTVRYLIAFL